MPLVIWVFLTKIGGFVVSEIRNRSTSSATRGQWQDPPLAGPQIRRVWSAPYVILPTSLSSGTNKTQFTPAGDVHSAASGSSIGPTS